MRILKRIILSFAAGDYGHRAIKELQRGNAEPLRDAPLWVIGIFMLNINPYQANAMMRSLRSAAAREWERRRPSFTPTTRTDMETAMKPSHPNRPNSIKPSIGRRVWFWTGASTNNVLDSGQAFDAGIVFVHPDGRVNLAVTDHTGMTFTATNVPLVDPPEDGTQPDYHDGSGMEYATWMPYQKGQAKAS